MDKIWLGVFDCVRYTDTTVFKTKELAYKWFDRVTKDQTKDLNDKIEDYIYREESEDGDFKEFLMEENPYCDWAKICIANTEVQDSLDGLFAEEDPNE